MEIYILGDTHHGNQGVVEKIKYCIDFLARGRRAVLFSEIFMMDERELIKKMRMDRDLLKRELGDYSAYIEYCMERDMEILPLSSRNDKFFVYWRMEEKVEERLFFNFLIQFNEIEGIYDVCIVDIGASHVKGFEEFLKEKFEKRGYKIKSFLIDKDTPLKFL